MTETGPSPAPAYARLEQRLFGASLVAGPVVIAVAALVQAAGHVTVAVRWYDSPIEALLSRIGWSLLLVGAFGLARLIGGTQPRLALAFVVAFVLGSIMIAIPDSISFIGTGLSEAGVPLEWLEPVFAYGPKTWVAAALLALLLVLAFVLAAIGLWRTPGVPKWSPVLLLVGFGLFMAANRSLEVQVQSNVAGTLSMMFALAPLGWRVYGEDA